MILLYKRELVFELLSCAGLKVTADSIHVDPLFLGSGGIYDFRLTALQLLQCLMMDLQAELYPYSHLIFFTLTRQCALMTTAASNTTATPTTHSMADVDASTATRLSLSNLAASISPKLLLINAPPDLVKEIFNTINCFFKNCLDMALLTSHDYSLLFLDVLPFIQADHLHFKIFIAESTSVFFRRLPSHHQKAHLLSEMLTTLVDHGPASYSLEKGVALIVFECIKSVDHQFQSKAATSLTLYLEAVLANAEESWIDACVGVTEKVIVLIGHHATAASIEPIIACICSFFNRLRLLQEGRKSNAALALYARILVVLIGLRKANRISPNSANILSNTISELFKFSYPDATNNEELHQALLQLHCVFGVYISPSSATCSSLFFETVQLISKVDHSNSTSALANLCSYFLGLNRLVAESQTQMTFLCKSSSPLLLILIQQCIKAGYDWGSFLAQFRRHPSIPIFAAILQKDKHASSFSFILSALQERLLCLSVSDNEVEVLQVFNAALFFLESDTELPLIQSFAANFAKGLGTCLVSALAIPEWSCKVESLVCVLISNLPRDSLAATLKEICMHDLLVRLLRASISPLTHRALARLLTPQHCDQAEMWENVLLTLKKRLQSGQPEIRVGVLYVLQAACPDQSGAFKEMLQTCIEICETELNVTHERQFPILISKLTRYLTSGDPETTSTGVSFLLGLYSTRFTPLFKHISECLGAVCGADKERKEEVWKGVWKMMQVLWKSSGGVHDGVVVSLPPVTGFETGSVVGRCENEPEEGFSKRDQPLASFQCSHINLLDRICKDAQTVEIPGLESGWFDDSVDVDLWICQLIEFLSCVPQLVVEKNGLLNDLFYPLVEEESEKSQLISKRKKKLSSFLSVFAKVTQPRKLDRSDDFYNALTRLLTNGDSRIQTLALDCIKTWQYPLIQQHLSTLQNLAQDSCRVTDVLATFDLETFHTSSTQAEQTRFMDLFVRLLYGKLVTRHARSSQAVVKSRVTGVFGFLCRDGCKAYRDLMVDLMLEPVLKSGEEGFLTKQLLGFLGLVHEFIKVGQRHCGSYLDVFLGVFIKAIRECEKVLAGAKGDCDDGEVVEEGDFGYLVIQARTIRTLAMKRLCLIFHIDIDCDFSQYVASLFECSLNGRIEKLDTENTQAPSVLLDLILVWSRSTTCLSFLELHPHLFRHLFLLCSAKKVHESVIVRVLEIIENVQNIHDMAPQLEYLPRLLINDIGLLLEQCKFVLSTSAIKLHSPESIPNRIIRILSRISVFVKESSVAASLLEVLVPFLKSSSKAVPETSKIEILRILAGFYPILDQISEIDPSSTSYYSIVSQLFSTLETPAARNEALAVFDVFVKFDAGLENVVHHLHGLNAMSTRRIDEVDFDRRFSAYSQINQTDYKNFTPSQWKPLLYNHIYQVGDEVEYSVRTSAAFGVVRFIEIVKERGRPEDYFSLIQHIVFPYIKKGLKVSEKLVRYEWIKLWGNLVQTFGEHELFSDMTCLLGLDDENNFYSNITHIQMHRRLKAVRMLASLASSIKPSNITHLISILCHFVYGNGEGDHNLVNESMASIAACCRTLSWGQYYNLIKRFMNSIKFRPELEKTLVRLIVSILDEFYYGAACESNDIIPPEDLEEDDAMDLDEDKTALDQVSAETVVQNERIQTAVTTKLIPSLQQLLAVKDDETLSVRTPLAVAITKLLKQLPKDLMHSHLPKLLLTLCNFLSSHLQSSRDSARSTLVTISSMLGPDYLSYIIKGLTTALTRGYQLHVLGYTLHAIITEKASVYKPGSIDSCVVHIVKICIQDIFGETGKEREVQELKGKMREIKSTKSFETLEHLCKVISFHQLGFVLKPIKEQMLETNDIKVVQHIENVFRRLSVGINANESIDAVHFMVFVQQLLSESLPLAQVDEPTKKTLTESEKRVQVLMKRSDASITLKYYEANVHMFVEFGLSLLLTSLKREKISPKIPEHLEMLDPLVPLIGRALYAKHASITVLALRILGIIIKLPLPELGDSTPVFVKRMFQLISRSSSTDGELIQAVFKLLVIVLRDCNHVSIPERQIITLLALLTPDLEDPEKETTTFSLIRSILERKYVTNEVYDLMDVVSRILVTSQSNHVRELCRGCYIHFLVYYPHGHARLRKQIAYLVSNLEYDFESGRASVLELFHLATSKFTDEIFVEYSDMLFLSVVLVLANDDSSKCREMAGLLIKELCLRLGVNRMEKLMILLNNWFEQQDTKLHQVSCQVIGLIVDAFGESSRMWIQDWIQKLSVSLQACYKEWQSIQEASDELDQDLNLWELGYFALKALSKIIKVFPAAVIIENIFVWQIISDLLLHPHSWIRILCTQIMGSLFMAIDPATRKLTGRLSTLASSRDLIQSAYPILSKEEYLKMFSKKFTNQLDSDLLTMDFAKQIIKNIMFVSKAMIPFLQTSPSVDQEAEEAVEDDLEVEQKSVSSLLWLSKRMCFLARSDASKKRGNVLRVSVFQWFAAIYKHIPSNQRTEFLRMMILTLYLVERDDTKKGEDADSLKQLATEVLAALHKETGTTDYVNVYQAVHEKLQQTRREKKTNRAIRAVSDPKAHALDRIKKSTAKVNARKRKAQEFSNKRIKSSHSIKLRTMK